MLAERRQLLVLPLFFSETSAVKVDSTEHPKPYKIPCDIWFLSTHSSRTKARPYNKSVVNL
jgi:hypothetical protein